MADPRSSSLAEAVRQVAQQQHAQASEAEESKAILGRLQTQLQDFETQINWFVTETKAVERQICHQEESITATNNHCEALQMHIAALYAENVKMKFDIETLQEEFKMLLLRNKAYNENIRAHKCQFEEEESKWPLMVEVANKRATIKDLIARKEELMSDLPNSEGNDVNSVQGEMASLESEINILREDVCQKQNTLQDEKNIQARLQKEIEVENKRCGAILKRLHCQVTKLQASQRQGQRRLQQVESQAAALRELLGGTD
ncbi:coiled-coil domain-containing protein 122 [Paroedura picta]|uniref:coiled-coil domain-containing protein 122 n=1 Tax=Paroedura picta TaxID=143630 RepID=UPI0040563A89